MKKSKLKIESLVVESFVVAEPSPAGRGTVHAFARPTQQETICQYTCRVDDCIPTFVYSCGYPQTQCPMD
jgi:hypothetical protein